MNEIDSPDFTTVSIHIDDIGHGGVGIGTVVDGADSDKGIKALCKFVIPGETVTATIAKREERLLHTDLVQISSSSPARREAPCIHFGVCGGCQLQHMTIEKQRESKRHAFERQLSKSGFTLPVALLGKDLPELNYRRRAYLRVSPEGDLGYYREGTAEVVAITECPILETRLQTFIEQIRRPIQTHAEVVHGVGIELDLEGNCHCLLKPRADKQIPESLVKQMTQLAASVQVDSFHKRSAAKNDDTEHEVVLPTDFSQVNREANAILIDEVLRRLKGDELITELYAGGGNFTIPLLLQGSRVTAVELVARLTALLQSQAKERNLEKKLMVYTESTERFCRRDKFSSTILLDPPRGGALFACQQLTAAHIKKIVYVSCNPATLIRDMKELARNGFKPTDIALLDMFSQTFHAECLVTLQRE